MSVKDEEATGQDSPTPRRRPMRNMLLVLGLLVLSAYLAFRSSKEPGTMLHGARQWYQYYTTRTGDLTDIKEPMCSLRDQAEDPMPAIRTEFGSLATIVYGWPSTGGVWVHHKCFGVELDFLGLNRFNVTDTERDTNPFAEDAFCKRMEYIGARFWQTEYDYNKQLFNRDRRPKLWTAWPGAFPDGGVWALWVKDNESSELGVARIRNALNMAERCKAIEMLGGHFFEHREDAVRSEHAETNDMVYDTEL